MSEKKKNKGKKKSGAHEVAGAPETTGAPEITGVCEVSGAPEAASAPKMTGASKVARAPKMTRAPKAASTPEKTKAPEMTGAQALIAALEAQGVKTVFGYPGAQAIRVYDALYDSKQITHILARHEQAATHMADGFARATGTPGVVLVTSGPGATNTVTGIATAYMDSSPLVVVSCNVSLDTIGTDGFQEADIVGITMPVVKHSFLLKHASDISRVVKEAFHIANTGRPGPVLIDIPANLLEDGVRFEYPRDVCLPSYKPTYKGNKKQVSSAAKLIEVAKRPVFYVGGGVASSGAENVLANLSNALQIPCVYTLMGKGCVCETSRLCAGFVGMHGATYANITLTRADLIVACGVRFDARVTGKISEFAPDAKIIHIDIDPAEIDKIRKVDVPIVGDVKCVLEAIGEKLGVGVADKLPEGQTQQTKAWLQQIDEWKQKYPLYPEREPESELERELEGECESECEHQPEREHESALEPAGELENKSESAESTESAGKKSDSQIFPASVLRELSNQLDTDNSVVVTEVGQHQMWASQLIERTHPRTFITSGGLGTMGFGFPAAIGAAIALKDANLTPQIVCISGDGSFQMNAQEMITAHANNTPVKVLLINNNCLGMVHQFQEFFYDERYSQTEFSENPSFAELAKAHMWQTARVSEAGQISQAIHDMLAAKGSYLLEVVVSLSCDVLPMVPPNAALDVCAREARQNVNPETDAEKDSCKKEGAQRPAQSTTEKEERHVLAVTVENISGVLSRVASLISRRGFNVESLSVGPTQDPEKSRITVVVWANNTGFEQITKQLYKLVSVYKVCDLTNNNAIERELVLMKVSADAQARGEIIQIANIFRANIVDVSTDSLTIEATGTENKVRGLEDLLRPYGITEMVRTGKIALGRSANQG